MIVILFSFGGPPELHRKRSAGTNRDKSAEGLAGRPSSPRPHHRRFRVCCSLRRTIEFSAFGNLGVSAQEGRRLGGHGIPKRSTFLLSSSLIYWRENLCMNWDIPNRSLSDHLPFLVYIISASLPLSTVHFLLSRISWEIYAVLEGKPGLFRHSIRRVPIRPKAGL